MPQPRSGAASARLGDMWYVVGGGNSEGGCVDTVALTLRILFRSQRGRKRVERRPVASEAARA